MVWEKLQEYHFQIFSDTTWTLHSWSFSDTLGPSKVVTGDPPGTTWFISSINCRYIDHKPKLLEHIGLSQLSWAAPVPVQLEVPSHIAIALAFSNFSIRIDDWIPNAGGKGHSYIVSFLAGCQPPEKYESQIGSSSQLLGTIKNVANHQPVSFPQFPATSNQQTSRPDGIHNFTTPPPSPAAAKATTCPHFLVEPPCLSSNELLFLGDRSSFCL